MNEIIQSIQAFFNAPVSNNSRVVLDVITAIFIYEIVSSLLGNK